MKHDIVLCDPPWSYYGQQDKWGAAAKFYPTMTDQDLLDFPIFDFANEKSVVFMWATSPRLDFAIDLLRHWGFEYRGIAFVWVKTKQDGTPIGAQGVRPSFVKPTAEFVIVGSTEKKGRTFKLHDESIRQVVLAPKTEHSRKPDDIHEAINKMFPEQTKIELFARRKFDGWNVWGNDPQLTTEETK